ncbi:MAG: SpoIIE family protein phosphatase [Treponema sp.]|nr:SpoIIE family protein phosphatase [Treponema sp.]
MIFTKKTRVCLLTGLVLLLSALFSSCQNESRIYLKDGLEWAICTPFADYDSSKQTSFQPFTDFSRYNISKLPGVGKDGCFVFLRYKFRVPEPLKNQDLQLVIPYLHFSYMVFFNSNTRGMVGMFPPRESSSMYGAHSFNLPREQLNQDGENEILLKVWCHGRARISPNAFIGRMRDTSKYTQIYTLFHSLIYFAFQGGMSCACLIYFFLYFLGLKEKKYLAFSFLNIATLVFMPYFYNDIIPISAFSYLAMLKLQLCIPSYFVFFMVLLFITSYLELHIPKTIKVVSYLILSVQVLLTAFSPSFNFLMRICPYMLILGFTQVAIGIFYLIKAFSMEYHKEKSKQLLYGFSPMLLSIVLDLSLRAAMPQTVFPFYSLIGWQGTIIAFLFLLTSEYYSLHKTVQLLNTDLENQVQLKTEKLTAANTELEQAMKRAKADLEMASIVQQKFFPYPNRNFRGWDIAICYQPLSEVSGDLYDYYTDKQKLNGVSMFDVSGHGIASSLITLLAKNSISQLFNSGLKTKEKVSTTLMKFNDEFIRSKGNVENYLTGVLFKFSDFDKDDACSVQMANAGHPYPILYTKETDSISSIKPEDISKQYGSIGMKDLKVSFLQNEFTMRQDDILVCYTDCLSESVNPEQEQFGTQRIMEIIKNNTDKPSGQILNELYTSLKTFTNGIPIDDDLTIIVLKREDSHNYIEELI